MRNEAREEALLALPERAKPSRDGLLRVAWQRREGLALDVKTSVFTLVALICNFAPGVAALLGSGIIPTLLPLVREPIASQKFTLRAARILCMVMRMSRDSLPILQESGAVDAFVGRLARETRAGTADAGSDKCIGFMKADRVGAEAALEATIDMVVASEGQPATAAEPMPT